MLNKLWENNLSRRFMGKTGITVKTYLFHISWNKPQIWMNPDGECVFLREKKDKGREYALNRMAGEALLPGRDAG